MQAGEFGEERVVGRGRLDRAHLEAEPGHFRAYGKLRSDGQQNHEQNAKCRRSGKARDAASSYQAK